MPARKRTNLNPDAPPEALAPRQAVGDPETLSDDVERILADLGEGASSVAVYRENDAQPGKFDFVARVPAPQFSNDYVASQYGGGNYQLIISDKLQGPLNPVYFSVDRRVIGKAFAVNGAPVIPGGEGAFKDRLLEILLARALTPAAPPPPHNTASETLSIITALAPLLRGNGGGGENPMEMVTALFSAATDMASRMGPSDGIGAVAEKLLPVVERLVTASGAQRRALPAPPPRPPVVQTGAPPVAAVPVETPTTEVEVKTEPAHAPDILPTWLRPFQQFAGVLVSLADTEADPALYADVCVDQLTNNEDAFRSAVAAMEAGTLKDDVLNAVPALKLTETRTTFVDELVRRVEDGLREVIAQEADTEGAANG
jgi:hypothetical protein